MNVNKSEGQFKVCAPELISLVSQCQPLSPSSLPLYLFSEVFGCPGFVISCSLPLLPPLSLLQSVFVLRGLVDVPLLQRLGDMLP